MTEAEKRLRLRRMRLVALAVVVAMFAIFVATSILQRDVPSLRWLRAFSEAGLAGALADWYAVVALFRRPLGLPIPHTAIIPRNKDRIAESIGVFIETHFLTSQNVIEKLVRFDLAATISEWLREPMNSRELADALCDLIAPTLATVEDSEIRTFFVRAMASRLEALDTVAILDRVMTEVIDRDRGRAMLARILLWLRDWVSERRDAIKIKFGEVSRYTPGFLDSYIVNRFVDGIALLLKEAAENPDHEIWREIDRAIDELRENMKSSPTLRKQIEVKAREAFASFAQSEATAAFWSDVKREIVADLLNEPSRIRSWTADALQRLGAAFADDRRVQRKLNAWLLEASAKALPRARPAIGRWVAEIVKSWDAEEIAGKLETEIGTDLQYIRLNGALVGGLVGLVLQAAI